MKYIILLIFVTNLAFSQGGKKERLLKLIENSKTENEKVSLYYDLATVYKKTQIDSSIYYAKKSYDLANSNFDKPATAKSAAILGDYFIEKNQFNEAKLYYSIYLKYLNKENHLLDYCQTKMIIANIESVQNNYTQALTLYYECLEEAKTNKLDVLIPHLYNNLGNLYFEIGDYKDAKEYFTVANKKFRAEKDSYNVALTISNISNIHTKLDETDEAIKGYLEVSTLFSSNGNWEDLVYTYHSLAEIYISKNQNGKAKEYITKAIDIIRENENKPSSYLGPISFYKAKIYATAAELAFESNKNDEAITFAHKSLKLSYHNSYKKNIYENARTLNRIYDKQNRVDSALYYSKIYIKYSEEYNNEYDLKKVVQLKMQYKFDDILKAKAIIEIKEQAENKRIQLIYLGISVFTILGIIIMILLYRNQKVKTAKIILTKEKLELEKASLDQDIEYKKKELASKMIYVLEKNEFIIFIGKKLMDLKPNLSTENQIIVQQVINEMRQNSSTKIWDEFEIRFKEVHAAFYDNLNALHPDLTPNEIKICAFLRLNMSTKEISAITHQSIKSINMARFRLRKKLNIETEDNLISYLIHL